MFQYAYFVILTRIKALHVPRLITSLLCTLPILVLTACQPATEPADSEQKGIEFEVVGNVMDMKLDEISGIATTPTGQLIVHNDDGKPKLWILNTNGHVVQKLDVEAAENRDWESLTQFEYKEQSILAIGDIGDNLGVRTSIEIYFVELPHGEDSEDLVPTHSLKLTYPDGPRDCEALAWDSDQKQLLFLTKRDKPPRLYSLDIDQAMTHSEAQLKFRGMVPTLRPPAREDEPQFGKDSLWISQPTGMDINAEGSLAAVITYRSLYLYSRKPDQTWIQAFQQRPREFYGPRSGSEEAIAFRSDMEALMIAGEGRGAMIFQASLPELNDRPD